MQIGTHDRQYMRYYVKRRTHTHSYVYAYNAVADRTRFDIIIMKETHVHVQCIDIGGHVAYSLTLTRAHTRTHICLCFMRFVCLVVNEKMNVARRLLFSSFVCTNISFCVSVMQCCMWLYVYLYPNVLHVALKLPTTCLSIYTQQWSDNFKLNIHDMAR